jgi:hypothetical protein
VRGKIEAGRKFYDFPPSGKKAGTSLENYMAFGSRPRIRKLSFRFLITYNLNEDEEDAKKFRFPHLSIKSNNSHE